MDGMTRSQVDEAESRDFALGAGPRRPRDAATLMLLENRPNGVHVLMGRRHERHAFMPGKFVFPGGATDPDDARVPVAGDLHPDIARKFTDNRKGASRTRAIAMSAVRETYEEAGLLIGRKGGFATAKPAWQGFVDQGVEPSLAELRYVARAITPPGRTRRFDAHFFAAWRTSVAVELPEGGPTQELQELVWLTLEDARDADIPTITKTVIGEVLHRLADDPLLGPTGPVPFYRMVRNRFIRDLI